jgi:hypothetical protein
LWARLSDCQDHSEALRKAPALCIPKLPIDESHPHAESAAESAEFAGAQGKFWEIHDLLVEYQRRLSVELYLELARELQIAPGELLLALEENQYRTRVRACERR